MNQLDLTLLQQLAQNLLQDACCFAQLDPPSMPESGQAKADQSFGLQTVLEGSLR